LALELTEAEERERQRLAEILHDDLQQVLVATKFHVGVLNGRVKNDAGCFELGVQVEGLLGEAIAKSRSLSHELSALALSQNDLYEAFERLTRQMQTKHGLTVNLEMCERIELASGPLRILLYKSAQELLFNVIKHAGVPRQSCACGNADAPPVSRTGGFDPRTRLHPRVRAAEHPERLGFLGGRMICSASARRLLITVPKARRRR
jgi:signal transduction histidine kinase